MAYIEIVDEYKRYQVGDSVVAANNGVNFSIEKGEFVIILGPTGALDYKTGKQVLKTLQDTCKKTDTTVIVITHNSALAPMADRVIHIRDAKVKQIELNENPVSVDEIDW